IRRGEFLRDLLKTVPQVKECLASGRRNQRRFLRGGVGFRSCALSCQEHDLGGLKAFSRKSSDDQQPSEDEGLKSLQTQHMTDVSQTSRGRCHGVLLILQPAPAVKGLTQQHALSMALKRFVQAGCSVSRSCVKGHARWI